MHGDCCSTVFIEAKGLHYGLKANAQLVHSVNAKLDLNENAPFFSIATKSAGFFVSKGIAFLDTGY